MRSLSQSYRERALFSSTSPIRSPRIFHDDPGPVQAQAAETHNDSPSASRPVPISSSSDLYDDPDVEANWDDDGPEATDGRGRTASHMQDRTFDLTSSVRDLSSTVQTTIWRGFDAIRSAAGVQRRPSHDDIDRDR